MHYCSLEALDTNVSMVLASMTSWTQWLAFETVPISLRFFVLFRRSLIDVSSPACTILGTLTGSCVFVVMLCLNRVHLHIVCLCCCILYVALSAFFREWTSKHKQVQKERLFIITRTHNMQIVVGNPLRQATKRH